MAKGMLRTVYYHQDPTFERVWGKFRKEAKEAAEKGGGGPPGHSHHSKDYPHSRVSAAVGYCHSERQNGRSVQESDGG